MNEIKQWYLTFEPNKREFSNENFVSKMENEKFPKEKILLIRNYLKKSIKAYEINSNILKTKDSKKIIILSIGIRNKKYIYKICEIIYSLFSKSQYVIIEISCLGDVYYSFNNRTLNIEYLDMIIKKKYFLFEIDNIDEINLNFTKEKLLTSSIGRVFESFCYKFVFVYLLKINYPFKFYVDYKILYDYSQIDSLEKEILKLNKQIKSEYNSNEIIKINNEIANIRNEIENKKNEFEKSYYLFK